ncbi:MAG: acetate--CoA ligase family protein [Armatimonadota bacterium]|nr:acetate--CoA ligase family protein [Armatimonadota bacterium]
MDPTLLPFFRPRGVALVGASHDPGKLGHAVAANLVHCGYRGAVHLVNPRGGRLFDRPVYPHLAAVPDPVDLAVLIVPAAAVPDALRACASRGIRAAVVLSGGFREVGPEGQALEEECRRLAHELGIRLLGPNCVGLIDTHLPLDVTFLPPPGSLPGEVAFISHSGAICAAVTDWASGQGFGLSLLISLGNQADLTESDVLAPVAEDPYTRVLTLYLEGIGQGRRFVEEAAAVARRKPIVALKVGRSAGGRCAAASHTGALAGEEAAYDAAFRRAGVLRAQTSEELFDWSRALAWCPLPAGPAVAVLTNAGGPGVIAADAVERSGLHLAELQAETQAALRQFLPPLASLRNPVDILASASPEDYARSLRLLLADPGVHSALVILPPPPRDPAEAVVEAIVPVVRAAAKPVVVALMGEALVRVAGERLRAAHVPEYRSPERAAGALAALWRRAEVLARPPSVPVRFPDADRGEAGRLLAELSSATGEILLPQRAARVVAAYGIPHAPGEFAASAHEAVEVARRIGFPVALKVVSLQIVHKSEAGGVLLDLPDAAAVAAGFFRIMTDVRRFAPRAHALGVYVQPMLPPGQEVVVGAVRDPQFGPLVMFGSGGVEVEELRDVAFALAPLTEEDADYLLQTTWAGRRLRGYRHLPPADRSAVHQVLLRVAQLADEVPEIAEVEINPLRVFPAGQGAVAVDTRVRLQAADAAGLLRQAG